MYVGLHAFIEITNSNNRIFDQCFFTVIDELHSVSEGFYAKIT